MVVANKECLSCFGRTAVEYLNGGVSYHFPALVSIGTLKSFGPKPFKLFSYWLEHKDFLSWIKEG
jgi:hypothetical protein